MKVNNVGAARIILGALAAAVLVSTPIAAVSTEAHGVDTELDAQGLTIIPLIPWEAAHLAVNGPQGFHFEQIYTGGGPIRLSSVAPGGTPLIDGTYRYEVRCSTQSDSGGERIRGSHHPRKDELGSRPSVLVHSGQFAVREGVVEAFEPAEPEGTDSDPAAAPGDQDLVENHYSTDLGTAGQLCAGCSSAFEPGNEQIHLIADEPGIRFQTAESSPARLWEVNVTTDDRFVVEDSDGTDILNIEEGASANLLYLGPDTVGIGTSTPSNSNLHLYDEYDWAEIRLQSFWGVLGDWRIRADPGAFSIADQTNGGTPLHIIADAPSYSFYIDADGQVAMGTNQPEARLHVNGSAILEGDVSLGSSRAIKKDLVRTESDAVLASVRELPVYHWKYIEDDNDSVHIGPMAEDMHDTFAVGWSSEHLSPADTAGVALAAVQGLDELVQEELEELRQKNARLRLSNEMLNERLTAIESRVGGAPPSTQ